MWLLYKHIEFDKEKLYNSEPFGKQKVVKL